jgi:hypothetical protein
MFDSLSVEMKFELISSLMERLKYDYDPLVQGVIPSDESRINQLFGSWKNLDIDGDSIVGSRTISERNIEF